MCPACYPTGSAECSVALPVGPVSLTAEWDKKQSVNINWITASEINNLQFEISRSVDAVSFELIGIVAGHGNSTVANYYSFADDGSASVNSKYIYYRIKQVDYDGNFKYYGPVSVKALSSQGDFVIYPNPIQKNTSLHLTLSEPGFATLTLVDVLEEPFLQRTFLQQVLIHRLVLLCLKLHRDVHCHYSNG